MASVGLLVAIVPAWPLGPATADVEARCNDPTSPAQQILEVAQQGFTADFTYGGTHTALRLRVSTEIPASMAVVGAPAPYNWSAPAVVVRQTLGDPNGTVVLTIKCDYVFGYLESEYGDHIRIGRRPASVTASLVTERVPVVTSPVPHPGQAVGESIDVLMHIYDFGQSDWDDKRTDPVNVVFYDSTQDEVDLMLSESINQDWRPNSYACWWNHIHSAWFWDRDHEGSDQWQSQNEEWVTDSTLCTHSERFHLREYPSQAPPGENHHCPTCFQGYILAPVHYDGVMGPDYGGPQAGQDYPLGPSGLTARLKTSTPCRWPRPPRSARIANIGLARLISTKPRAMATRIVRRSREYPTESEVSGRGSS